MNGFSKIRLGAALTLQRGYDITKAEQTPGDVPIVSSSGISSFHNRSKAKGPGVIIGRKGTLGTVHFLRQDYWPHDTTLWVKDFKGNNPEFVSYFLQMLKLENFDTGAANPTLNRNHVHKIEVIFPKSAVTQRKIAAILTAYDDLIETNKRRIALLEKMAEELYREWFVRMRFPGHQNTKFIKGMPVGWEVKPMGKVANIVMGLSPKGDTYNETGIGMPLVNGPVEFAERFTKRIKWTTAPNKKCKAGDLVVCVRGSTTGKFVKSDGEYCLGRGVCSISSKHQSFVDQMFKEQLPILLGMTSGSTFPSWTGPQLQSHPVFSPPEVLKSKFEDNARPMNDLIQDLSSQSAVLAQTRDLLLPRLISGKLSVEDLDVHFPPSMENEN